MVKDPDSLGKGALVEMEQSKIFFNIQMINMALIMNFSMMISGGRSRMTAKFLACAIG